MLRGCPQPHSPLPSTPSPTHRKDACPKMVQFGPLVFCPCFGTGLLSARDNVTGMPRAPLSHGTKMLVLSLWDAAWPRSGSWQDDAGTRLREPWGGTVIMIEIDIFAGEK